MKQYFKVLPLILVVFMALPALANMENDFDGRTYALSYHDMVGTLTVDITVNGMTKTAEISFPMAPDMPGAWLDAWLADVCDPTSESFNPVACMFFSNFFTPEIIDGINEQWNTFYSTVIDVLPSTLTTRQLPWPANNLGSLALDNMTAEWPCTWNPDTGDYEAIPLEIPIDAGSYENFTWVITGSGATSGNINREHNYRLNGAFTATAGLDLDSDYFMVQAEFSITGNYTDPSNYAGLRSFLAPASPSE